YTQTGGILNLTIQQKIKDGESSIEVKDPTFLPTYVDIDEGYKVYPMFQLNDDQLSDSKKKYEDIKSHMRSEEHTSELQSRFELVCRLLLEKKKKNRY